MWTLEAADINSLARGGIDSAPMAVGDRITVRGWLSSHGRNALFVNRAVLADGQEIVMGFERKVQDTDAMEVVERFTLSEDNERLDYSATITDPAIFAEPAHFNGHWTWVPGEVVKPFDCANPG